MARTPSTMIPLGTLAPLFNLPDMTTGEGILKSFEECKGENGTVVMFICNHCPYVIHIFREIVDIAHQYTNQGVGFVAINSNDIVNYPEDAPDKMSIVSKVLKFNFPYLFDESQAVAKSYEAACTPDFYVFDKKDQLVYRGQLDNSRPKMDPAIPVTGKDLRNALNLMIQGVSIPEEQYPSLGCNIKWKSED